MSDPFNQPGAPTSSTPGQTTDDFIRAHFGFESWMLDVPELRQVLEDATTNNWDQARIDGALGATNWFKQHSLAERNYQGDLANDPAGVAAKISQVQATVTADAAKVGVNLPPDRLKQLATNAVREGWDSTQISQAVGYEFNYIGNNIPAHMENGQFVDNVTGRPAFYGPNGEPASGGPAPGLQAYTMPDGRTAYYKPGNTAFSDAGRPNAILSQPGQGGNAQGAPVVDQLKQIASQYLVPLSDQMIQQWGQNIASGQVDLNGFTSYMKEQAKSMFPSLGAAIDSGVTVVQYADPYKQLAAQTLQIAPDSVDFTQPQWQKALTQVDPKTGARTSMSLSDWQTELRSNPTYGYSQTQGAKTQAYDSVLNLAKSLGAIA